MPATIGLVVALPTEARALVGESAWQQSGGWPLATCRLHNDTVALCILSGMGMDRAYNAARHLATRGICTVGSIGLAGGLVPGLTPGTLIAADATVEYIRDQSVQPPGLLWELSKRIHAVLLASGAAAACGMVLTVVQPILRAAEKSAIGHATGALAVDMESAAVAAAAEDAGMLFFGLRAICDTCDTNVPAAIYRCLDARGRLRPLRLLGGIALRQITLRDLYTLQRQHRAALGALQSAWRIIAQNSGRLFDHPARMAGFRP